MSLDLVSKKLYLLEELLLFYLWLLDFCISSFISIVKIHLHLQKTSIGNSIYCKLIFELPYIFVTNLYIILKTKSTIFPVSVNSLSEIMTAIFYYVTIKFVSARKKGFLVVHKFHSDIVWFLFIHFCKYKRSLILNHLEKLLYQISKLREGTSLSLYTLILLSIPRDLL